MMHGSIHHEGSRVAQFSLSPAAPVRGISKSVEKQILPGASSPLNMPETPPNRILIRYQNHLVAESADSFQCGSFIVLTEWLSSLLSLLSDTLRGSSFELFLSMISIFQSLLIISLLGTATHSQQQVGTPPVSEVKRFGVAISHLIQLKIAPVYLPVIT